MKKMLVTIVSLVLLMLAGISLAETEEPSQPLNAPNASDISNVEKVTSEEKEAVHNFPLAEDIAGNNLDQQKKAYLKRKKLTEGFNRNGSYIGWGMSSIDADPKSIDFAQKRIMAFEKAFADAKGKFVQTKKQSIAVKLGRQFIHTDISENDFDVKDGKFKSIGNKIAAITEARLDKMLVDLDIDPKEIENSDIIQKRKIAEDSLQKEITIQSVQSVPGIIIIATFEDLDAVGVLIKQKQSYVDLAYAIASRKLVGYPSKTDPVDDIFNQLENKFTDDTKYLPQYGVRIMTDENGNRVLVSFGQWSPKVTRNDDKMKVNMAIKAAKEISQSQALSYMTQFINTSMALKNTGSLKDSEIIREISRTGNVKEEVKSSDVGASVDKFIEETSRVSIEGVASVYEWAVNHPETGHLIVGTVNMWSPTTQEYARQKPIISKSKPKEHKMENRIRQSVDLNNDDF